MVAALGDCAEQVTIDAVTATSKHYLTRMHLYDFLGLPSPDSIIEHEASGRFMPLTRIQTSNELSTALEEIVPLLHLPPEQARSMRYIVSELVRNVLEHANTQYGAIICAQYYAKSNTIRLGIVDTGIGIKQSIDFAHRSNSDIDAIKLALMPGITGTTRRDGGTDYNAGAGLFFIKSIASINQNPFLIYSGKGMYKLLKSKTPGRLRANANLDNHSEKDSLPYWQGTVVGIDISLESTEAFTTLLDLIGKTYAQAVRERRKERYKKARFI
jgi:anti-sigma regulatory factor (Ser/Thr protein kinase)